MQRFKNKTQERFESSAHSSHTRKMETTSRKKNKMQQENHIHK
jgi:hypothetical protein